MSENHLATYLNDHLGGSVVGLNLLDRLVKENSGARQSFFAQLHKEVTTARQSLEEIMTALHVKPSVARQSTASVAAIFTQLKMRLDDPGGGTLRQFEALEGLVLGIGGQRALWQAMIAAAEIDPRLRVADFESLAQRADDQFRRVESLRLEAAKAALAGETMAK